MQAVDIEIVAVIKFSEKFLIYALEHTLIW